MTGVLKHGETGDKSKADGFSEAEAIWAAGLCHCRSASIAAEAAESRGRRELFRIFSWISLSMGCFQGPRGAPGGPRAAKLWRLESQKSCRRLDIGSQSLEAQLILALEIHHAEDMTIFILFWREDHHNGSNFWDTRSMFFMQEIQRRWCFFGSTIHSHHREECSAIVSRSDEGRLATSTRPSAVRGWVLALPGKPREATIPPGKITGGHSINISPSSKYTQVHNPQTWGLCDGKGGMVVWVLPLKRRVVFLITGHCNGQQAELFLETCQDCEICGPHHGCKVDGVPRWSQQLVLVNHLAD